jgi:hypothetical protein
VHALLEQHTAGEAEQVQEAIRAAHQQALVQALPQGCLLLQGRRVMLRGVPVPVHAWALNAMSMAAMRMPQKDQWAAHLTC